MNTFMHSIDEVNSLEELEDEKYLQSFIWNRIIPGQDDKGAPESALFIRLEVSRDDFLPVGIAEGHTFVVSAH